MRHEYENMVMDQSQQNLNGLQRIQSNFMDDLEGGQIIH